MLLPPPSLHRLSLLCALLASSSPSLAANATSPAAGAGSPLRGTVRLKTPAPPRARIEPRVDAEVCNAKGPLLDERLIVSPEGGVANAVVYLLGESLPPPPATLPTARVAAKGCRFEPHVQALTAGAELELANDDPLLHNVHAYVSGRTLFNLGLPEGTRRQRRTLREPGVVLLRSDAGHNWMRAYAVVLPTHLHAVTDASGNFVLPNVPPGSYRLVMWHERLGTQELPVTVKAGEESVAGFSFDSIPLDAAEGGRLATASRLYAVEESLRGELEKTRTALEGVTSALAQEKRERALAEGRPLYLRFCATCHGTAGDGKGPSAPFLSHPPRNFLPGDYQFRMTPSGTLAREEDIFRTLTVGVLGTPMPAWGSVLTVEQRRVLSRYVLALSPRSLKEKPGAPIEIPPEPPSTNASIAEGKQLFQQLGCFACHGETGRGDGAAAPFLVDDMGNPISPADFTKGYYQGGRGAAVVYRAISTGLSGSPMPSFGDSTTPEQRWALVHYIRSLGHEPGWLEQLFSAPAGRIQVP